MTIQPNKIYEITKTNGEVLVGKMFNETLHSKIFKDKKGKFFEIENSEIKNFKLIQNPTNTPYKHEDTDKRLKYRKSGIVVPTYKQY